VESRDGLDVLEKIKISAPLTDRPARNQDTTSHCNCTNVELKQIQHQLQHPDAQNWDKSAFVA